MSKKQKSKLLKLVVAIIILGLFKLFPQLDTFIESEQNEIQLINCIDGDTAKFSELGNTRFLFIDTPESTRKIEKYGIAASEYTCSELENAQVITYEYDGNKKDRYDRSLAWIFVDGELLQEKIAQKGYVKKFYDYGSYKYEDLIRASINDKYNIFEGE